MKTFALSLVLVVVSAQAAFGADITAQPTLTLEGAKRAVAAAMAYARSHGAPGAAIAIVDAGGHTICLERLDGTFPASAGRFLLIESSMPRVARPKFAAVRALPIETSALAGKVPSRRSRQIV